MMACAAAATAAGRAARGRAAASEVRERARCILALGERLCRRL